MKKFLLVCFSLVFAASLYAQERTVSGKVTSTEDGSPLPGVNVVLKGTSSGTVTDASGNYRLTIPQSGGSLTFSFIGLQTQEVAIGDRSVVDVSLRLDVTQLGEVVVTAQGIQREKRALGYGVSTVGEQLIAQRPESDIGRILQGKVPGLNITSTGGVSGTGTNITIRGYSSISGSNQPLFVVDGVPFNSNTNNQNGFTTGGQTTTSRFLDLDPNNIENINVLKGLSATVLYGDQGRNGVILITTKSGSSKKRAAEISIVQSVFANKIASLPTYQNDYGNGFQQLPGLFFSNWGPRFKSPPDSIAHPLSTLSDLTLRNQFPEFAGKKYAIKAYEDPGTAFFRTGVISNTSLAVSGSTDKTGYTASFGYTKEEGFTPGNTLEKFNFGLGINVAVTEKLSVNSSFTYAITDMATPPLNAGFGSNASGGIPSMFANVFYTGRSIDLKNLPFEAPVDRRSVYYRAGNDIINPKWLAKYHSNTSFTNRFFNATSINYDILDNLALTYRIGLDTYTETQENKYNKGQGSGNAVVQTGMYRTIDVRNTIWNQDLILSYNNRLSDDLNLTAKIGGNARNDFYTQSGIESSNQLAFGLFRHNNFTTPNSLDSFTGAALNFTQEEQRMGVYADLGFDFKEFLYLNLSGRHDWTSTVEPDNRTIFYPGASVSFIPTTAFEGLKSDVLNELKVRLGTGSSAGFPSPYRTRNLLAQTARAFIGTDGTVRTSQTFGDRLGNPNLKPELHQEVELGFEGRMLKNRISFDLSLYQKDTRDLITTTPLDPSTGFTSTTINIGKIRNKGVELSLTGNILRSGNLSWDATVNFATYRSTVEELGGGLDEVVVAGFTDLGNFAIPGKPFNIIRGTGIQRDANGNKIVAGSGEYLATTELVDLGDPNPEFNTSLINTLSWKGIVLSFFLDYRHGGTVYSTTVATMLARGLTKDVEFDRSLTMILPGVKQDGTPNDIQVTGSNYFFDNYFGTDEGPMIDATTIRLREVSLGYTLPSNIISKTPFKSANITLSGTNLWFSAINAPKYVNFDTDVLSLGVGNGLGFDYLTGPSSKRYGATLRLTF